MAHYRTRPTVIQAIRAEKNFTNRKEIEQFIGKVLRVDYQELKGNVVLVLIYNYRKLNVSDWIVKHPDGEIDIETTEEFNKKYEPV